MKTSQTIILAVFTFVVGYWTGKRVGRMEVATYVWNVLVNNRTKDMAGAICLYVSRWAPLVMAKNGFRNIDDAYEAIKSERILVDN